MSNQRNRVQLSVTAVLVGLILLGTGVSAQRTRPPKTDTRILYHNGQIMAYASNLYFIWFGCWECGFPGSNVQTQNLVTTVATSLGGSPYMVINSLYPNNSGMAPSGGIIFGGAVEDRYSTGSSVLSESDVEQVVANQLYTGGLPLDTRGIYVVLTSSDVHVEGLNEGRCQYHRAAEIYGSMIKYAVITNPQRAPSICAPQFTFYPPPNGDLAGDAIASMLAHVLNGSLTNPTGMGWYDKYGLENSDKCEGSFGDTYITPNGGRANMNLRGLDLLIQQNWVNVDRGYCGLHM